MLSVVLLVPTDLHLVLNTASLVCEDWRYCLDRHHSSYHADFHGCRL